MDILRKLNARRMVDITPKKREELLSAGITISDDTADSTGKVEISAKSGGSSALGEGKLGEMTV